MYHLLMAIKSVLVHHDAMAYDLEERSTDSSSLRAAQREMAQGRILAAARAAFAAEGVTDASIDSIARRAGVGRATVYRHFSGKEALLIGLLEEDWDRQVVLFQRLGGEDDLDIDAISAWLRRLVRAMQARREVLSLYSAVLHQLGDMSNRLARQRARLVAALGGRISAFADPDPVNRVAATLLVMQVEQFCAYAAGYASEEEIEIATGLVAGRVLEFVSRPPPAEARAP